MHIGRKPFDYELFGAEVDDYIHWYNEKRMKISPGSLSPVERHQSFGLNI